MNSRGYLPYLRFFNLDFFHNFLAFIQSSQDIFKIKKYMKILKLIAVSFAFGTGVGPPSIHLKFCPTPTKSSC